MERNKCPQCNATIVDATRIYCPNCGFDLSNSKEHQLEEEREFIEGYSHNYPYIWFACIFIAIGLAIVGAKIMDSHKIIGIILMILVGIFGFVLPTFLTVYLKKSQDNYGKNNDEK